MAGSEGVEWVGESVVSLWMKVKKEDDVMRLFLFSELFKFILYNGFVTTTLHHLSCDETSTALRVSHG